MSHRCPKCNGRLYNRRSKICGFCGATLSAALLFTAAEIAALDKAAAEAEQRYQQRQAAKEAAQKQKPKRWRWLTFLRRKEE